MLLLTNENKPIDTEFVQGTKERKFFFILDVGMPDSIDMYCLPLLYLDRMYEPAAELLIGNKYTVSVPLTWKLLVGDPDTGEVEVMDVHNCMGRDIHLVHLNPITGFKVNFSPVELIHIYPDLTWHIPKATRDYFIAVPLEFKENPDVIFIGNPIVRERSLNISDFL